MGNWGICTILEDPVFRPLFCFFVFVFLRRFNVLFGSEKKQKVEQINFY